MEIWFVEGRPTSRADYSDTVALPVVVIARSHKEAREEALRLRDRGFRVFAWDMMGSGQFSLSK